MPEIPEVADHYQAHYRDFAARVYAEGRRDSIGEDVGQNGWLTLRELEQFASQLELGPGMRLLDVACGSGGPALHLVEQTGCSVVGVELYEEAVDGATRNASERDLHARARFVRADAGERLPFEDESFEATLCLDSLNHLPRRPDVFAEWARVLTPGGRLLFTDPVVVTGAVGSDELAIRSSIGYFLFAPPGENERLLAEAGLEVLAVEDTTESLAEVARRRHEVRVERAAELRALEGDATFEGRQRFLSIVARLAEERRLSRFAYLAAKAR